MSIMREMVLILCKRSISVAQHDDARNVEVNNQPSYVDESRHEGSRSAGRVKAATAQDKRQHRTGDGPEGHDANQAA